MLKTKRELENSLPFAMDPVVYNFAINDHGTRAQLRCDDHMPAGYHALMVPRWLGRTSRSSLRKPDVKSNALARCVVNHIAVTWLPSCSTACCQVPARRRRKPMTWINSCAVKVLIRSRMNRFALIYSAVAWVCRKIACPNTADIQDVSLSDIQDARRGGSKPLTKAAEDVIAAGGVAVVTLAAGCR